jgi:hypothetical protein
MIEELIEVFTAIDGERRYQKETWPKSEYLPTTGEISLLRFYLSQFDKHYQESENSVSSDVPEECLEDLRKMVTILCRAMQNHGVRYRRKEDVTS